MSVVHHSSTLAWVKRRLPEGLKRALKILLRPSHVAVLPYPHSYCEDGLATTHSCGFTEEPSFHRAYLKGVETGSWDDIRWRAHVYCWAATQAFQLPGDFVECGVNRGGYARMVFEYLPLASSPKRFFLLDTFNGLDSALLTSDEIRRGIPQAYHYTECFAEVQKTFADFPNAVLVRGRVPGTLSEVDSPQIAFLSIDMNCVEPEIAAANYFWDRIVPGGVIVLDDYGHPLHVGQRLAFDAFARDKGVVILALPTAQGIIVKPRS